MSGRPGDAAALVAVVGGDGAGKSTLTGLLHRRLTAAGTPARRVDRWDVLAETDYPSAACLRPDERQARSCAARMSTGPRLLFLLWASALALTDRAGGMPGEVVLLDGYWMKHAAAEIAYGADPAWVEAVAAGLPAADLVVHLRVEPELAWARKDGRPLPFECGMDLTCSRSSFLAHQGALLAVLDRWADRHGWLVLDATAPTPVLADQVIAALADRRATMEA
ncbi:dTMP kinase [Micromonospora chaiyaphumensis]|uniref:Thymidylate kinase n=1 Tax=Micromonospora chaiyaphumensis TaxID=307119 RepID=A0A1C4W109_9ACTN|nr:hypothetical protein [Micromonospora chaiyaphumensis]SCE89956.1 dTMP kinase [Micromonospora chaiyaphumensis]